MKNKKNKSFGSFVKDLRQNNGLSIKKLGSKLDINYSYISKIENNHSIPSKNFIEKIAEIFGYDKEELMLRAGKIPEDIIEILKYNPKATADFLREKFVNPSE